METNATQTTPARPVFQPVGETGLLITFSQVISPQDNQRVHALARALQRKPIAALEECVPGYSTLLVRYDPRLSLYEEVAGWVRTLLVEVGKVISPAREVRIPVRYGGADGMDLPALAAAHGMTEAEVIRRHSAPTYTVMMMGFLPGFPYLGGLDVLLATPRLTTPRALVPAGSVGIAGAQTCIYPLDSPGGWQIIGRTRLELFNPRRDPFFLLQPGDLVSFVQEQA